MKQKLALARAMLHQPRLLLLDEPTAGLDVRSAVAIRDDLRTLANNNDVTIFLTSHNMDEVEKLCHCVAVINHGRLIAQGTPDELGARWGANQVEILGNNFTPSVLEKIQRCPDVVHLDFKDHRLILNTAPEIEISEIVTSLVRAGAQIDEVRRVKASLEEVFLTLTGDKND